MTLLRKMGFIFALFLCLTATSAGAQNYIDPYLYTAEFNQLSPSNQPIGRQGPGFTGDENGNLFLFGGYNDVRKNDLYQLDLLLNSWTELSSPISPTEREGQRMVYENEKGGILMFGGSIATATTTGDTWFYNLSSTSWQELSYTTSPSSRYQMEMAYDSIRNETYLFGGVEFNPNVALDDLWVHSFDNGWTQITPTNNGPSARYLHHMEYLPVLDALFVFGGRTTSSTYFSDTWLFFPSNSSWVQLNPQNSGPTRFAGAMEFDYSINSLLFHGGSNGVSRFSDTWMFDPYTLEWYQLEVANSIAARAGHFMEFDRDLNESIVIGGNTGSSYTSQMFLLDVDLLNVEDVTRTYTRTETETDTHSTTETGTTVTTETVFESITISNTDLLNSTEDLELNFGITSTITGLFSLSIIAVYRIKNRRN